MTMDYSPWVKREFWLFLKVAISPKPEKLRPPKSVHMHNSSIPTCMNFLSRFRSVKIFDDHGLYIVHGWNYMYMYMQDNMANVGHVNV